MSSAGGIVFSLEKGEVWASWYGHGAPVHLGSQRKVSEMMEDFLAQVEVGKRLNRPIIIRRLDEGLDQPVELGGLLEIGEMPGVGDHFEA